MRKPERYGGWYVHVSAMPVRTVSIAMAVCQYKASAPKPGYVSCQSTLPKLSFYENVCIIPSHSQGIVFSQQNPTSGVLSAPFADWKTNIWPKIKQRLTAPHFPVVIKLGHAHAGMGK
ncbi:hypothetical protein STEG23_034180, partial [Scotinomys teguina]